MRRSYACDTRATTQKHRNVINGLTYDAQIGYLTSIAAQGNILRSRVGSGVIFCITWTQVSLCGETLATSELVRSLACLDRRTGAGASQSRHSVLCPLSSDRGACRRCVARRKVEVRCDAQRYGELRCGAVTKPSSPSASRRCVAKRCVVARNGTRRYGELRS